MFCQSVSRMVMDVVNPAHINAEREDDGWGGGWGDRARDRFLSHGSISAAPTACDTVIRVHTTTKTASMSRGEPI